MTTNDLKRLAFSMIRQAQLFKAQGKADFAVSLAKRAITIRSFAGSMAQAEPILVPIRTDRR